MKQCPSCLTMYPDETLRFCLADGSVLTALDDEQATVVGTTRKNRADETLAMNAPTASHQPTVVAPPGIPNRPPKPQTSAGSSTVVKVVIVVIAFIFIGLLLAGAAGALFYFNSGKTEPTVNVSNGKQTQPSPTPTKDDRDDLRDQIANLQKQLNEQKKSAQPSSNQITLPKTSTTTTTARANSPSDGFLALRSLPSSEIGERILKIPHGATVTIGACGPVIKPVSKSGRWCQASYNGYSGWVFDAFIEY